MSEESSEEVSKRGMVYLRVVRFDREDFLKGMLNLLLIRIREE